ncbi:cell division protein FtsK [Streptomyces sp. LX-29]|uniref:FtsK/SpoIIIE domain-containing protein n=1 Tax=Streptomyces sp. LX-29 TaxID=2900152 RepID=UPI00240E96A8|nr:FtsK/SpoIIIE domain-containing protein [Streptomyces sp. LX-29]WFB09606.1 cell division protein FtsK [Streptomyces sp. LX-29]
MLASLVVWLVTAVLCVGLLKQRLWEHKRPTLPELLRQTPWRWYLIGYPTVVVRMRWTWRRLCRVADLSITPQPRHAVLGRSLVVSGRPMRQIPPRLGLPRVTRLGLTVRVQLHPGQTPRALITAADAFAHAWRVHSVRVAPARRGEVLITVIAHDPLTGVGAVPPRPSGEVLLSATVGMAETGQPWVINLRRVPHWLIVGATRSGKSTLLAALITELAPQPVALVGIDCKGGVELTPFMRRLSALACTRHEALALLGDLITEAEERMAQCREAGVRSIWELPEDVRPAPIVAIVDEVAELYLVDGSRAARTEAEECSTALLRVAQLGAALGIHLVAAAQRLGSELGRGVTALRAQLGGRVCHAVHDAATAEMALGDLAADAVEVALSITEEEPGVAVTTVGGRWLRVRSALITTQDARRAAAEYAGAARPLSSARLHDKERP